MLRSEDVAGPSQLATEERDAIAQATHMAIHGTMMAVQAERHRAPSAPIEPELRWVDNDALCQLDHDTLWTYAITVRDAYYRLHGTCRPRPIGQVYIYTITYSFECFIKIYVLSNYMNLFLKPILCFVLYLHEGAHFHEGPFFQ